MFWLIKKPEELPSYTVLQYQKLHRENKLNLTDEQTIQVYKEIKTLQMAKGRNLYGPNNKSLNFFLSSATIKLISGGNRAGKTLTCAMDVIMQCEGWHPLQRMNLEKILDEGITDDIKEWAEYHLENRYWIKAPPIKARCEVVDFPSGCEKIAGPTVMEWATQAEIKESSYDNEKKRRIIWKNDSLLEFMSHDQDLDSHGGVSRDVIWEDEEPPSEIHQENLMRILDSHGRILIGMTAVKGITWVKDEIYDPWEKGKKKNVYCVKMRTIENPAITEDMVQTISDQCLDDDERAIRLEGEFKARGGLVYFMAKDKEPWIIDPFAIPKDKGLVILNIDTHIATPHGLLWQWIDYDGIFHDLIDGKPNYYNIREMFMNGTVLDMDQWIKITEKEIGRAHNFFVLEQGAWSQGKSQTNPEDKDLAEQFMDLGYYPERGSKDLSGGIQFVRTLLLLKEDATHPRLMTFRKLERLRWERSKYQTPDLTGRTKDRRAPSDKPLDKDDHFMECERRGCQFVNDVMLSSKPVFLDDFGDDFPSKFPKKREKKHYGHDGSLINIDFDQLKEPTNLPYNSAEDL